jgi:predicted nucleotidyltransferase
VTKGHQLLRTRLGDLDVLGTIMEASGYDDLIADTVLVDLEGVRVRVLELSKVIEAKEFAGRPKDHAALPSLRATLSEIRRRESGA